MRYATLFAMMATAAVAGSHVALIPQDWFDLAAAPHAKLVEKPIFHAIRLGELEVVFEKTRLKDIQARVGSGIIRVQGDAADSETWLCYRFHAERGMAQIDLISGEMGGGNVVTGIVLREGRLETDRLCPELPPNFVPIATDIGPGLGSRFEDFTRALGKPSEKTPVRTSWEFEHQVRFAGSPELWFVEQSVHARFKDGKADLVLFSENTTD
jgi:hypothetical protein